MRPWILLLLSLSGLAIPTTAQYWHDTQYLIGGYRSIYLARGDGSTSVVVSSLYAADDFCMDVDNYHILAACQGRNPPTTVYPSTGMFGIYRFDPQTGLHQTLYGPDPYLCWNIASIHVDYNGDYVFTTAARMTALASPVWRVMKLDRQGVVSTVLTTLSIGRPALWEGRMRRNIDTGKILLHDRFSRTGPNYIRYPVLEFGLDGSVATWSTGGLWGWDNYYSLPQNHWNGCLEGTGLAPLDMVFRLAPGTSSRTTLGTIFDGYGLRSTNGLAQAFDLQTGAQRRWAGTAFVKDQFGIWHGWLTYLNPLLKLTSVRLNPMPFPPAASKFEFFRGRHIQTVRIQPNRWSIWLSCPRSPGYRYVLGAGLSGVRPAIFAPGYRRINICPDPMLFATVQNRLPGIWKPGPGVLNTSGQARAELDLRSLKPPPGGLGIPLWIVMVVLDPKSPCGIKYVPDTYVMRI